MICHDSFCSFQVVKSSANAGFTADQLVMKLSDYTQCLGDHVRIVQRSEDHLVNS